MRLIELQSGESARISGIEGTLCKRLIFHGIAEGRIVTRISGSHGPVVIRSIEGTVVLGRGMAFKIHIQKV